MYFVYVNDTYVGYKEDAHEAYQLAYEYCNTNGLSYGTEVNDAEIRFKTREQHEELCDE